MCCRGRHGHPLQLGRTVATRHDVKDFLKTRGSVRVLMAPKPLMELIGLVIDVFHTDPHGAVNLDTRLIPGIQTPNTGG